MVSSLTTMLWLSCFMTTITDMSWNSHNQSRWLWNSVFMPRHSMMSCLILAVFNWFPKHQRVVNLRDPVPLQKILTFIWYRLCFSRFAPLVARRLQNKGLSHLFVSCKNALELDESFVETSDWYTFSAVTNSTPFFESFWQIATHISLRVKCFKVNRKQFRLSAL